MAWQPSQAGLQQIAALLTEFQKPGANQPQVLSQLDQCRAYPDFNNYLAFIFASGEGLAVEVRQGAGLLLKNNLRSSYASVALEHQAYVKEALLRGLTLPHRPLRHTAGTCAVAIVSAAGIAPWPQLPVAVAHALESGNAAAIEGALDALYKIWEEVPMALELELPPLSDRRPSDALVPRVLAHFQAPDAETRALAVSAINLAAGVMPKALVEALDKYMGGLFSLAHDPSPAVRKAVCTGLVQLTTAMPDRLSASLGGVIEYMLASTQDADEGVAVEACEFWSAFPESGLDVAALRPFLPRLLPVLLKNMVYEEYDDEVAEAEAAEAEGLSGRAPARERDADVRPAHLSHHATSAAAASPAEGDGDGEDGDGDKDDGEEEIAVWNLRRCSAAGLDMLSSSFGDELLPLLLPAVQARLAESDWRSRESAILALGAVSEGCAGGLVQHLPSIVQVLLPALADQRPMVRCISCWALTRYSRWVLDRAAQGQRGELDGLVAGVCQRVGDHNWKVQEAACSSMATLAEEANNALLPYARPVLTALGAALQRYTRRAVRHAYDAAATVADRCPDALRSPEGAALILPPLFARLEALADGDRDLLPLLECLTAVAQAAGSQLDASAAVLFARCMNLADGMRAAVASGAYDEDEADDFIVAALDCLSGMAEGLGAGIESLVARTALRDVVVQCCSDANPEVRQSAFALVGDLSKACGPHMKPVLPPLMAAALRSLEPGAITQAAMSACNNAAWAAGELAAGCSADEVQPYALPFLERLARILAAPAGGLPRSLVENAAIALGRLAASCPDALAPHAAAFVGPWCGALRGLRDGPEKESAFLGLCALLSLNPGAGAGAFTPLCEAAMSWRRAPPEGVRGGLGGVMRAYREQLLSLGQWEAAMATLSPAAAQKLAEVYQLV